MEAANLAASPRARFGKGPARKLRASGRIPAIIQGRGRPPVHISVNPHELHLIFRKSGNPNTLVSIRIEGEGDGRPCLLKDFVRHPLTRDLLHADFYEVSPERELRVEVPVKIVGRSQAEKLGGRIRLLRRSLPVVALPADLPAFVEVDVTHLQENEFVRISQIPAPAGTRLVTTPDRQVLSLLGKRVYEGEVPEEEEEGPAESTADSADETPED